MSKRSYLPLLTKKISYLNRAFLLFLFIFCSAHIATAQTDTSAKAGSLRQLFTQANLMMNEHLTDSALKTFLLLYHQDTANANACYFIGRIYLGTSAHKADALPYLEKAMKHIAKKYQPDDPYEKDAPPPVYYYLARAQHINYQFDNAILNFTKFQKMLPANDGRQKDIDYWINCCNNAKMLMESPVDCKVIDLSDSINSPYPDYNPVVSADESEILFTSNRPTALDSSKDINNNYYADIWMSFAKPANKGWTTAQNISSPVNTGSNEVSISLSPDGQNLVLYRGNAQAGGNLYVSHLSGITWTYPAYIDSANMGVINGSSQQTSACMSPDGKTLYFASNRSGGFGGLDIYKVSISDSGKYGLPVNLGPDVNTEYDEDAPCIHVDDSTMFFSSKGHNTMGGYDVFIAKEDTDGHWSHVRNIGYPINTPEDDTYFSASADGRRGYYTSISSVRRIGYGDQDNYEVLFHTPLPVKPVAVLVGYIQTPDGSPMPNDVTVVTNSIKGAQSVTTRVNPITGKFLQVLRPNQEYNVAIETGGKKVFNQRFFLPIDSSYLSLSRAFFRTKIILGDTANVLAPHIKKATQPVAGVIPVNGTGSAIATQGTSTPTTSMSGRMLLSNSPLKALANTPIQLLDEHGHIVETTFTNSEGYFTFDKLSTTHNYIIKANVKDSKLRSLKTLLLANSNGTIVRNYDEHKRKSYLYNSLPTDLNSLPEYKVSETNTLTGTIAKTSHSGSNKTTESASDKGITYVHSSSSGKITYIHYFGYNESEVPDTDMASLANKIEAKATKGHVTVYIQASASRVPTKLFPSGNAALSSERAKTAKKIIIQNLSAKQTNLSTITFKIHSTVQGPAYRHDASHLSKYKKYQYVKVYIR